MNPFSQTYVKLPITQQANALKWHPGHAIWMAPGMWTSAQSRNQLFNVDIPAIVAAGAPAPHIQIHVYWNDIEPTNPGVYNWDFIDSKIALINNSPSGNVLGASKCKFMINFLCRTYGGFSSSVPAYMQSAAGTAYAGSTGGTNESRNGEYKGADLVNAQGVVTGRQFQAKLHVQDVADRYRDAVIAIGQRYDSNPDFVGMTINETAMLGGVGTGMTPVDPRTSVSVTGDFFNKWSDAVIAARAAFPTTPMTWMANFPAAGILSIFDPADFNPTIQTRMLANGIGGHEQDFYPRSGIVGQTLNVSYDANDAMAGITPRFTNMSNMGSLHSSNGNKTNPTPPATVSQLAQEARARGVNIILWHVVATVSGESGDKWRQKILPLLLANNPSERPASTFPSYFA